MQQWQCGWLRGTAGRGIGELRRLAVATSIAGAVGLGTTLQACVPDGPTGLDDDASTQEPVPGDPEGTGSITSGVSTEGTGSPGGLLLALNDAEPEPVEADGSRTWRDVPVGGHAVELSGVPANCTVLETNPRQVTVERDVEARADFTVSCLPATGDLRVTASSHGEDIDRNGYRVELEGGSEKEKERIDPNGTVTFAGLEPGEYSVKLEHVDDDCEVESENPVTADVIAGALVEVGFVVECDD